MKTRLTDKPNSCGSSCNTTNTAKPFHSRHQTIKLINIICLIIKMTHIAMARHLKHKARLISLATDAEPKQKRSPRRFGILILRCFRWLRQIYIKWKRAIWCFDVVCTVYHQKKIKTCSSSHCFVFARIMCFYHKILSAHFLSAVSVYLSCCCSVSPANHSRIHLAEFPPSFLEINVIKSAQHHEPSRR